MLYGRKWPEYAGQWNKMKVVSGRKAEFEKLAQFAFDHRQQYLIIEENTGVPWAMIACLHRRESDADFTTYLGNGDPLKRKTVNVPKGRGPFPDFEAGAIDALKYDRLSDVTDWRLEKALYYMELFNGAGYANKGLPSPYLWAGTNIQKPGKFVSDGRWSGTAVDKQPGCAPILMAIIELDPSSELKRED